MSNPQNELPDVAEVLAGLLSRVPGEHQPLLIAIAERLAAERYRGWADDAAMSGHRDRLRACADREESIAARIESLYADAAEIQTEIRAANPELEEVNRTLFAGRPLLDQMAIQANGERLGAATWRSFAADGGDGHRRETLLACAELEEQSAVVLEDILAGGAPAVRHLAMTELEAGLDEIRRAPRDKGVVRMIVRRPRVDEREVLEQGELDLEQGLVGDNWKARGYRKTPDGSAHPDMQLNIMNARAAALVAQDPSRWPLAGDQLYLDLDLSGENLPPGTRLSLGGAVIEVTAEPHTGCSKFVSRFGKDAMKFVNSEVGRELNLRGINAKVVSPGAIRVGDTVTKV